MIFFILLGRGREITQRIQRDQRESLSQWIDYSFSEDTNMYPTWAKIWSFGQMVKLGQFNRELAKFSKRGQSTVAPFAELNREALAYVLDGVFKVARGEDTSRGIEISYLWELLKRKNFGKLYAHAILKLTDNASNFSLDIIDGKWIKYKQGSDHRPLVGSLCGKNTGWCTATSESTAKSQLELGDFYVYYSNDQDGLPIHPRIAIRMEGERIGEIRGVGPDQNLDAGIAQSGILEGKLKEFGGESGLYFKRVAHMKKLTTIENKSHSGQQFTKGEVRFLYQIDEEIQGFGYANDPRISEIIKSRNMREDLAYLFDTKPSRVSLTKEEALSGNIVYYHGDIDLSDLFGAKNLILPSNYKKLTLQK